MLAHVGTITLGYAAGSLTDVPSTFWDLTVNYPGMLLALAGTACLVMVSVTSIRAARRRLRYESWHLLHLYAYLGVGLALPHQLWTGGQFIVSADRTVFWWTAWAASAGSLLVWRVGRPVWRNLRHRLRVTAVVDEAPGVWSVHVTGRHLTELHARGRAVLHLAVPRTAGLDARQPLLAVGRTRRQPAADHRAGRRRRQRLDPVRSPRARACWWRDRTAG